MRFVRRKKNSNSERRSQVTGVPKASSYHYSARRMDSQKTSDRQVALSDNRQNKWGIRLLIGLTAVLSAFGFLLLIGTLTGTPSIKLANQNNLQNSDTYKQSVANILGSSVLNRSKLTLDRQKIINDLKQSYPSITSVRIDTPLLSRNVQVTVESSEPALRLASGGKVYVLSDDGRVIGEDGLESAKDDLPLIEDKSSVTITTGKPALTSQQVLYIKEVIAQSKSRGLQPNAMELVAGGGELDVRYKELPYFVKFNFFEDARKSSGTFFAVKDRLEIENNPPKEYIDVRVAERAYVK